MLRSGCTAWSDMNDCCLSNIVTLKRYDPQPKNPDGSIRWFLFRWDDGKSGYRTLDRCDVCGSLYLTQHYRLNKFSSQSQVWYEDRYAVHSEAQADSLDRGYTGPQLEKKLTPAARLADGVLIAE